MDHLPQTPTVHTNGTAKDDLIDQRVNLFEKLQDAAEALCSAAPNGRDFYVRDGAMDAADRTHGRRLAVLRDLIAEVESEIQEIDMQD